MEMEQVADVFGHPIASPPSPFFFLALRNECCDATLLLQESFASVLQGDYSATGHDDPAHFIADTDVLEELLTRKLYDGAKTTDFNMPE
ncbi:MAG: hypothetical protein LQ348_007773 [Seirophora lacunosa]|nr:MAG: hypothetical protein LQ348_007773 [Seirophora lacunosa]